MLVFINIFNIIITLFLSLKHYSISVYNINTPMSYALLLCVLIFIFKVYHFYNKNIIYSFLDIYKIFNKKSNITNNIKICYTLTCLLTCITFIILSSAIFNVLLIECNINLTGEIYLLDNIHIIKRYSLEEKKFYMLYILDQYESILDKYNIDRNIVCIKDDDLIHYNNLNNIRDSIKNNITLIIHQEKNNITLYKILSFSIKGLYHISNIFTSIHTISGCYNWILTYFYK